MGTVILILLGLAIAAAVAYFGYRRLQESDMGGGGPHRYDDVELDDDPLFADPVDVSDPGVEFEAARGDDAAEAPAPERPAKAQRAGPAAGPAPEPGGEELILAVYVLAPSSHDFAGPDVRAALEAERLQFGSMGIYHRHSDEGPGAVFSVANAMEPGTLEPDELDTLQTRGLACFMRLPGPIEGAEALEQMLDGAKGMARRLGGDVYDETRSVLRAQTEEHLREKVRDYTRRRRLAVGQR
ncbi:MAG TPA: cell division protein ZipA [Gammaproteobacteria bacterium]|nr:cell division protein ZipA [Gammaproteobacteria bacterium]